MMPRRHSSRGRGVVSVSRSVRGARVEFSISPSSTRVSVEIPAPLSAGSSSRPRPVGEVVRGVAGPRLDINTLRAGPPVVGRRRDFGDLSGAIRDCAEAVSAANLVAELFEGLNLSPPASTSAYLRSAVPARRQPTRGRGARSRPNPSPRNGHFNNQGAPRSRPGRR